MHDAVVIGAGLAGLAAACDLAPRVARSWYSGAPATWGRLFTAADGAPDTRSNR